MASTCTSCGFPDNEDGAKFCKKCGVPLSVSSDALSDGGSAATEAGADDATKDNVLGHEDDSRDIARWRSTLANAYRDSNISEDEKRILAKLRGKLAVSGATLSAIEEEVRDYLRQRVVARVPASVSDAVPVGTHMTITAKLTNVDSKTFPQNASCEFRVDGLEDPPTRPLGEFGPLAEETAHLEFVAHTPGRFNASLAVTLVFDDAPPMVLRSRRGDLIINVEPQADKSGQNINVFNVDRVVGDLQSDKSVRLDGPGAPRPGRGLDDEWRTIDLEYDAKLSAEASEAAQAAPRAIVRSAQYRSGMLVVRGAEPEKRITVVMSAVVKMGRNRIVPTSDCPRALTNDIQLRVEPVSEPGNIAKTLRITQTHLTLCCYGDKVILTDGSTNGTTVNRAHKLKQGEEIGLRHRAPVGVADVLDLDFEVFRSAPSDTATPLDFSALCSLKDTPDALNALLLGYDKDGQIDAVRIRRLENLAGALEHLILIRQARIGSSPYDVIQLCATDVQERHARLLVDRGQLWIECLSDSACVHVGDLELSTQERAGVVSGDVIMIGDASVTFQADPL